METTTPFRSNKGYYSLDAWVLANVIQLAVEDFCRQYLDHKNDPCGRRYDQMAMAARSITANIAEGVARHQSSRKTEMNLLDVARASAAELHSDLLFFCINNGYVPWSTASAEHKFVKEIALDSAELKGDWDREVALHIRRQKEKFDRPLKSGNIEIVINALLILCNREQNMIEKLLQAKYRQFTEEGGFTEALSAGRIKQQRNRAAADGAPQCPDCGSPMLLRTARKGRRSGVQFWSCSNYPRCSATREYTPSAEAQS